jgi:hypothetical protein
VKDLEWLKSRYSVAEKGQEQTLYRFAKEISHKPSQDAAFDPIESEPNDGTYNPEPGSKMSNCR